jgi:hypothetical protein
VRATIALALLLAGCGSAIEDRASNAPPFTGALTARAAVDALECDGETGDVSAGDDYHDGLAEVRPTAAKAFDSYFFGFSTPRGGYRFERREDHRALVSYDVRDRTKVAVVLADDVRDYKGGKGWGVVAHAQCDPSEFGLEVSDDLDLGVWTDASGRHVPTTRLRSFHGAQHCNDTNTLYLIVGPSRQTADWYVRDVQGKYRDYVRGRFERVDALPGGAWDTGYHRRGGHLWLAPDAAYVVTDDYVERWPKATGPLLCA